MSGGSEVVQRKACVSTKKEGLQYVAVLNEKEQVIQYLKEETAIQWRLVLLTKDAVAKEKDAKHSFTEGRRGKEEKRNLTKTSHSVPLAVRPRPALNPFSNPNRHYQKTPILADRVCYCCGMIPTPTHILVVLRE